MLVQLGHRVFKALPAFREIQAQRVPPAARVYKVIPVQPVWEPQVQQVLWVQQDQVAVQQVPADQQVQWVQPGQVAAPPAQAVQQGQLVQLARRVFKVLPALWECREMQELPA
jgi:hypothetical protein